MRPLLAMSGEQRESGADFLFSLEIIYILFNFHQMFSMKAFISTASRSRKSVNLSGTTSRAKSSTSRPALGSFADFCLGMFGVLLFAIALLAVYVIGGEMAYAGALLLIMPFIVNAIKKGGNE